MTASSYKAMTKLYTAHRDSGLEILAFPCNQFANQEPWDEAKIKEFVTSKFQAEYQFFSKININGEDAHPVYKWLKTVYPGDITWNFASKFIIDKNGIPIHRFNKGASWEEIEAVLVEAMKEEPAKTTESKM